MRFRPCIDLRNGRVVQIVGGTLGDGDAPHPITNFETDRAPAGYAEMYRRNQLCGGHVIALGPGNREAALSALSAYPGGMQMGGGITPIVRRIELGFAQGVRNVDASISFISDYVGDFDDPQKGALLAETQYTLGADVIYQVAGRCGLGAIETARRFNRWIISTGGDHSDLAPKAVLTSRIKSVGRPVKDVINAVIEDRFEGGEVASYGFAEGGLMMAPIRPTVSKVVTPPIQGIMQEVQAQVISGKIKVELEE